MRAARFMILGLLCVYAVFACVAIAAVAAPLPPSFPVRNPQPSLVELAMFIERSSYASPAIIGFYCMLGVAACVQALRTRESRLHWLLLTFGVMFILLRLAAYHILVIHSPILISGRAGGNSTSMMIMWDIESIIVMAIFYSLMLLPAVLLLIARRWYWGKRYPPGHCRSCGYNLRGLDSERCPECGHAINPILAP